MLTPADLDLLAAYARFGHLRDGSLEESVRHLGLPPARIWQRLVRLASMPAAMERDPLTCRRIREAVEARRKMPA